MAPINKTEEELRKLINDIITERNQNLGIYDEDIEGVKETRKNNAWVDKRRKMDESNEGTFKRTFSQIFTSLSGNIIWVMITAAAMWILQYVSIGHKP